MSIEELNGWKAREYDALKASVAELESVRDDLSRAYAVQGLALEEERARVAELEAWQLAIAEGTGFINRSEGQDGYEVADPQTILDHLFKS